MISTNISNYMGNVSRVSRDRLRERPHEEVDEKVKPPRPRIGAGGREDRLSRGVVLLNPEVNSLRKRNA